MTLDLASPTESVAACAAPLARAGAAPRDAGASVRRPAKTNARDEARSITCHRRPPSSLSAPRRPPLNLAEEPRPRSRDGAMLPARAPVGHAARRRTRPLAPSWRRWRSRKTPRGHGRKAYGQQIRIRRPEVKKLRLNSGHSGVMRDVAREAHDAIFSGRNLRQAFLPSASRAASTTRRSPAPDPRRCSRPRPPRAPRHARLPTSLYLSWCSYSSAHLYASARCASLSPSSDGIRHASSRQPVQKARLASRPTSSRVRAPRPVDRPPRRGCALHREEGACRSPSASSRSAARRTRRARARQRDALARRRVRQRQRAPRAPQHRHHRVRLREAPPPRLIHAAVAASRMKPKGRWRSRRAA